MDDLGDGSLHGRADDVLHYLFVENADRIVSWILRFRTGRLRVPIVRHQDVVSFEV